MKISYVFLIMLLSWFWWSCSTPSPVNSSSQGTPDSSANQNKAIDNSSTMFPSSASSNNNANTTKEPTPPSPRESGNSQEKDHSLPPEVTTAIIESGIPIYEGNTPPKIEGYYHVKGHVTTSHKGRPSRATINTYSEFFNQLSNHVTEYEEFGSSSKGKGWITGQNNTFTVYIHAHTTRNDVPTNCRYFAVFSGNKEKQVLYTNTLFVYLPSECPNSRIWGHPNLVWEKHQLTHTPVEKPKPDTSPPTPKEDTPPNNEDPNRTQPPPPPPPPPGPFP